MSEIFNIISFSPRYYRGHTVRLSDCISSEYDDEVCAILATDVRANFLPMLDLESQSISLHDPDYYAKNIRLRSKV